MRVGEMKGKKRRRQNMNRNIIRSLNSRVVKIKQGKGGSDERKKVEMRRMKRRKLEVGERGQKRDFFFSSAKQLI